MTKDYSVVTFVSEDRKQFQGHKFILGASSKFLEKTFVEIHDASPFIFLQGVESSELLAIMKFIYTGEAEVSKDNIEKNKMKVWSNV